MVLSLVRSLRCSFLLPDCCTILDCVARAPTCCNLKPDCILWRSHGICIVIVKPGVQAACADPSGGHYRFHSPCICVWVLFRDCLNNTSWWYIQRTEGVLKRYNILEGQEARKGVSSLTGRALNNKAWNAVFENAQGCSINTRAVFDVETLQAFQDA